MALKENVPAVVMHCDWSKDQKKRWMAVAIREGGRWHAGSPEPVGETADLFQRAKTRAKEPGALLAGFDFPIGLPAGYGQLTGFSSFPEALQALGRDGWTDWFKVCDAKEQVSVRRPFYPMAPGGKKKVHLEQGIGLEGERLLRRCERKTARRRAACSLFWTLGGNQVGKGAIAGWQEVIQPQLETAGLWPFEGRLGALLERHDAIIVETYPADAYGQIGITARTGWSKRKQLGRAFVAPDILKWIENSPVDASDALLTATEVGFSARAVGEDQFDAVVGLLGMLDTLERGAVDSFPDDPDIKNWEGWIFGQDLMA